MNFKLTTSLGDIDVLGEIAGGGDYHKLIARTIEVEIDGMPCPCLDLDMLITVKKVAGRKKDLDAVEELEALKQERDRAAGD